MNIETWTSNKGQEEIHHFIDGEQNTYVFGINAKLLGDEFYGDILRRVMRRLQALQNSPFNYAK